MAISPDLLPVVDLTVYDRSAEDIRTLALTAAADVMPEWIPREGHMEVVLLEALALEVAEAVYGINRTPGALLEALLALWGVERDPGGPAVAEVEFSLVDNLGHTVPAGTRVRIDLPTGSVVFTTDADATADPGELTVTAAVTAESNSAAPNGLAVGTALAALDQVYFVNSIEISTEPSAGRDTEDVTAWLARGSQRLRRLSEALVLAEHFTAAALEDPAVHRATTIDLYDGVGGSYGEDNGHVTVIVRGAAGDLTAPQKAALLEDLEERALANLEIHVLDAAVNQVDVTADISLLAGHVEATVIAAVEAALEAYLDPAEWPWDETVRLNDIIALIDGVTGVDTVIVGTVELNGVDDDLALVGDGPLADADTLTITVV